MPPRAPLHSIPTNITLSTEGIPFTGVKLAGLSEWVGTLGLDYQLPLGTGDVLFQVDSMTRSPYNSDTSASQYTRIGGYNVTNASVGYRATRASWA